MTHAPIDPTNIPPGYPEELEADVVLADGTRAHMRPIVPDDAEALADEILTADSETLYLRFFTTSVKPDDEMMERLTVLDYRTALAVGMIDVETGESMGIARYAEVDAEAVEVAVSVKREWRRRGIADRLLDTVEAAARRAGYRRSTALYLLENAPAAALFERRGYRVVGANRGIVEISLDLIEEGSPA